MIQSGATLDVFGFNLSPESITVAGTGDLVHAVTSTLARHHVVANGLRIEQASLGDAYIALTGRRFDD